MEYRKLKKYAKKVYEIAKKYAKPWDVVISATTLFPFSDWRRKTIFLPLAIVEHAEILGVDLEDLIYAGVIHEKKHLDLSPKFIEINRDYLLLRATYPEIADAIEDYHINSVILKDDYRFRKVHRVFCQWLVKTVLEEYLERKTLFSYLEITDWREFVPVEVPWFHGAIIDELSSVLRKIRCVEDTISTFYHLLTSWREGVFEVTCPKCGLKIPIRVWWEHVKVHY